MEQITRNRYAALNSTIYTDSTRSTPQNLTGVLDITFTADIGEFGGPQAFQKTLSNGITVLVAANGTIKIDIMPADTTAMTSSQTQLAYSLSVTMTTGKPVEADRGYIRVLPDAR